MKSLFFALALVVTSSSIFASNKSLSFDQVMKSGEAQLSEKDVNYFSIGSVEVHEVAPSQEEKSTHEKFDNKDLGSFIMSLDKLWAFGTKVWKLVKEGRPVVNVSLHEPINVIPQSEEPQTTFYNMENWSAPIIKKYRVTFKNLLGMEVINFAYIIHFQAEGSFKGKGAYLTGLSVSPSDVSVAWGYKFDALSELVTISNRGTAENPTAGVTMEVSYKAETVLKEISSAEIFHITGKGEFIKY
jgi:hypothetical protein